MWCYYDGGFKKSGKWLVLNWKKWIVVWFSRKNIVGVFVWRWKIGGRGFVGWEVDCIVWGDFF